MTSSSAHSHTLRGLALALVAEGMLDEITALTELKAASEKRISLTQHLVETKKIPAREIAYIGSKNFGAPLLDLDSYDTDLIPIHLVSEKLIQKHGALPLYRRGDSLFIAVADPSKQVVLDEIQFHTGLKTHCIVVEEDKLLNHINKALAAKQGAALEGDLDDSSLDNLDIISGDELENPEEPVAADDAPVVRFVNKVLLDAIQRGASDIHFEPYDKFYRVRLRIDGMLHEIATPPANLSSRIAARLKVMSQLDISERRIPHDGRFLMTLSRKHAIDFRISTCPTVNGEKIVMRILDPTTANLGIERLGFTEKQRDLFMSAINQPQGMVLVTGPTGSGKTVTLYTALNILNTTELNISTAEDPVEIKLQGVNQVNINNKVGLTFSVALRAFLRQDPDIIMVGEMRDLETAEIGVKAAQTGHLVLSTLHTNSAAETLSRLRNMGVAPYNIASSASLIIAQRLARRLCEKCKKIIDVPPQALLDIGFQESEINSFQVYHAEGCEHCTQGYKGRVGLYEVLPITKEIGEIIMSDGSALEIEKTAVANGMLTIRQAGLQKIKEGVTSIDEISRVTKD